MGLAVAIEERTGPLAASPAEDPGIFAVSGSRRDMVAVDPLSARMVTDLSDVALPDSSGLGALVGMLKRSHGGRAHMARVCPHRHLSRVFEVTGLREAVAVGHDVDGAIPALEAGRPRGTG